MLSRIRLACMSTLLLTLLVVLKENEVHSLVESLHQRHNAYPSSRVVSRLEEPNFIGGSGSPWLSFSLVE